MLLFLVLVRASTVSIGQGLTTARKMTTGAQKRLLDGFKSQSWYFAKFAARPDLGSLKSEGISVSCESILTRNWMKLFLTSRQASFLVLKLGAELFEVSPSQKILGGMNISNAVTLRSDGLRMFDVECCPGFILQLSDCQVEDVNPGHLRVGISGSSSHTREKLKEIAAFDQVFSISQSQRAVPMNRWASPFVQSNTNQPTNPDSKQRAINDKGLTGQGVTVLVSDTGLDVDSTFFYDDAVPDIEANKLLQNHRKVAYFSTSGKCSDNDGHGTHVAGTIAGNPVCQDCPEQYYYGVAKDAKLGIFNSVGEGQQKTDPGTHLDLMKKIGATISSNSWGMNAGADYFLRNSYDRAVYDSPEHLFVFAVGNSGARVESPSTAKNVLSVGGLSFLAQAQLEQTRIAMVISGDSFGFALELVFENSGPATTGEIFKNPTKKAFNAEGFAQELEQATDGTTLFLTSWNLDTDMATVSNVWLSARPHLKARAKVFVTSLTDEQLNFQSLALDYMDEIQAQIPPMSEVSSVGAAETGILKPEVVAPSELMKSALAFSEGQSTKGHVGLSERSGTSMAAPLVSGSLALIEQYFKDGYYCTHSANAECSMKVGNSLLRAMIVASADPLESAYSSFSGTEPIDVRKPLGTAGFGSVNLEKVLPFSDSKFSLHVAQDVEIKDGQHLVAKVKVTETTRDLRIVMSYLDPPLSVDSLVPLAVDLDLFVLPADKSQVFIGNHNTGTSSEHFSTIERVIINSDELKAGEYTIHVYCHDPYNLGAKFSVVSVGPTDQAQKFEFVSATSSDYKCMNEGKVSDTKVCQCPDGFWGPLCTAKVYTKPESQSTYLPQNDPLRFSFDVPDSDKDIYLDISHGGTNHRHNIYLTTQDHDAQVPIDFETAISYDRQLTLKVVSGTRVTGMVVNLDWELDTVKLAFRTDESFPITAIPEVTTVQENLDDGKKMDLGAGVAGWVIAAVAIVAILVVVLVLVVCKHRATTRYSDEQPQETIP